MIDYDAIRAEYLAGGISIPRLAAKHGVSGPALHRRSTRQQWGAGRRAVAAGAQASADADLLMQKSETLVEINDACLRVAKAVRDRVQAALAAADLDDAPMPASTLVALARAAESAQRIGRLALGVGTERQEVVMTDDAGDPFERITRRLAALADGHGMDSDPLSLDAERHSNGCDRIDLGLDQRAAGEGDALRELNISVGISA